MAHANSAFIKRILGVLRPISAIVATSVGIYGGTAHAAPRVRKHGRSMQAFKEKATAEATGTAGSSSGAQGAIHRDTDLATGAATHTAAATGLEKSRVYSAGGVASQGRIARPEFGPMPKVDCPSLGTDHIRTSLWGYHSVVTNLKRDDHGLAELKLTDLWRLIRLSFCQPGLIEHNPNIPLSMWRDMGFVELHETTFEIQKSGLQGAGFAPKDIECFEAAFESVDNQVVIGSVYHTVASGWIATVPARQMKERLRHPDEDHAPRVECVISLIYDWGRSIEDFKWSIVPLFNKIITGKGYPILYIPASLERIVGVSGTVRLHVAAWYFEARRKLRLTYGQGDEEVTKYLIEDMKVLHKDVSHILGGFLNSQSNWNPTFLHKERPYINRTRFLCEHAAMIAHGMDVNTLFNRDDVDYLLGAAVVAVDARDNGAEDDIEDIYQTAPSIPNFQRPIDFNRDEDLIKLVKENCSLIHGIYGGHCCRWWEESWGDLPGFATVSYVEEEEEDSADEWRFN